MLRHKSRLWVDSTRKSTWRRGESNPCKSARRDGVVSEDPTEFVETVRRERAPKIKRPFTLPERLIQIRSNLNIQFFGYLLVLFPKLPINLQTLLESRDRRVDGSIFQNAGKFAISLSRKSAYLCPRKNSAGRAPFPRAVANASQPWAQTFSIAAVILDHFLCRFDNFLVTPYR